MWVSEHQGLAGNEEADQRAKEEMEMGWGLRRPYITTPRGLSKNIRCIPCASTLAMVHKIAGLHGYGQGTAVTMAKGDGEDGRNRDVSAMDGHYRTQRIYSSVHGWGTGLVGWRSRCGGMRSGASRYFEFVV